jgi:hypothetical protein
MNGLRYGVNIIDIKLGSLASLMASSERLIFAKSVQMISHPFSKIASSGVAR